MSRIDPIPFDDLTNYEDGFAAIEAYMGFVPSSLRTMARVPGLLDGFTNLARATFLNDLLPDAFKQLIADVASAAAGCRYCQAHTVAHAEHLGVDPDKLADLWHFETSDRFTHPERGRAPPRAPRRPTPQRRHRHRLRRMPPLLHRRPDHRHRRRLRTLRLPQPLERHHGHHPRSRPRRRREPGARRCGLVGRQARMNRPREEPPHHAVEARPSISMRSSMVAGTGSRRAVMPADARIRSSRCGSPSATRTAVPSRITG